MTEIYTRWGQPVFIPVDGNGNLYSASNPLPVGISAAVTFAAGENHVGQVGGHVAIVMATFTRPADTNAYSFGDLIANATGPASVAPLTLSVARHNDGTGIIRRLRLKTNDTAFAAATIRVHLYKDSPIVSDGDNGAFLTTESNYIGYADIILDRHFSDYEKGFGIPVTSTEWSFEPSAGTKNIFALLETRTALTPASAKSFTLAAEVHQN